MSLDERKKLIMTSIVNGFIETAEPVGSRTVAKTNEIKLSPATIRNEMYDLEEMGYLEHPHTSAGRVPSVKGYRLYVDDLMKKRDLRPEEIEFIKKGLEVKIDELTELVKQASNILSTLTNYTSIASTPQFKESFIKSMQVVYIDENKLLLVLVTNEGVAKHSIITINDAVLPDDVIKISTLLNNKLSGKTVAELNIRLVMELADEIKLSKESLLSIFLDIAQSIGKIDRSEVYMDGARQLLNYHEFKDIERAKEVFDALDKKELLGRLLLPNKENKNDIIVKIGNENNIEELKDCSVVTATYSIGEYVIGSLGVVGPKRMDYPKVVTTMDHIRKKLNEEFVKITKGGTFKDDG